MAFQVPGGPRSCEVPELVAGKLLVDRIPVIHMRPHVQLSFETGDHRAVNLEVVCKPLAPIRRFKVDRIVTADPLIGDADVVDV